MQLPVKEVTKEEAKRTVTYRIAYIYIYFFREQDIITRFLFLFYLI